MTFSQIYSMPRSQNFPRVLPLSSYQDSVLDILRSIPAFFFVFLFRFFFFFFFFFVFFFFFFFFWPMSCKLCKRAFGCLFKLNLLAKISRSYLPEINLVNTPFFEFTSKICFFLAPLINMCHHKNYN